MFFSLHSFFPTNDQILPVPMGMSALTPPDFAA
jgi:hypothetical protein